MLYMQTKEGNTIVILEPVNLQHLAKGGVAVTPDNSVAFMYTPDAIWMGKEMTRLSKQPGGLAAADIDRIHTESMSRVPVVVDHNDQRGEMVQVLHNGQPVSQA